MIQPGAFITIKERLCSKKVQPSVMAGARYEVLDNDTLADGTEVLVVKDLSAKSGRQRVNAKRFRWEEWHDWASRIPKTVDRVSVREMADAALDYGGKCQIGLIPLVCQYMAMHFSESAADFAAKGRVSILKEATRAARNLRGVYDREVEGHIGYQHRVMVEGEAKRFLEAFPWLFITLYYSVNNEFKHRYPTYPHDELRTYAIMSILFTRYNERQLKDADAVLDREVKRGLKAKRYRTMPAMAELMSAMAGIDGRFDFSNQNIELAFKAIDIEIHRYRWTTYAE